MGASWPPPPHSGWQEQGHTVPTDVRGEGPGPPTGDTESLNQCG